MKLAIKINFVNVITLKKWLILKFEYLNLIIFNYN